MSFDALGKMSVGAAAGVVAERGGYVDHALSQLSDSYGTTAEAFGLPALPDAKGLVASNAETLSLVPTSAAEAFDFVNAGLKAARDMLQQYLPEAVKMPEVGASAERSADSLSASLAKANGEANKTLVTTGFFIAGFGVSAAVYSLYAFGPETLKTRVDKHYAITRRALHEISVRLDRKLRDANVKARLEKVNATLRRFVSTFRASVLDLIDASRTNVSQALVAAAPVAADVEAALRRCSREVYAAVAPACLDIAEQVRPKVESLAKAFSARAKHAWRKVERAVLAWEAAVARALGKGEK
jgi:hypothetical protein